MAIVSICVIVIFTISCISACSLVNSYEMQQPPATYGQRHRLEYVSGSRSFHGCIILVPYQESCGQQGHPFRRLKRGLKDDV